VRRLALDGTTSARLGKGHASTKSSSPNQLDPSHNPPASRRCASGSAAPGRGRCACGGRAGGPGGVVWIGFGWIRLDSVGFGWIWLMVWYLVAWLEPVYCMSKQGRVQQDACEHPQHAPAHAARARRRPAPARTRPRRWRWCWRACTPYTCGSQRRTPPRSPAAEWRRS
jgi:hypothetical protein